MSSNSGNNTTVDFAFQLASTEGKDRSKAQGGLSHAQQYRSSDPHPNLGCGNRNSCVPAQSRDNLAPVDPLAYLKAQSWWNTSDWVAVINPETGELVFNPMATPNLGVQYKQAVDGFIAWGASRYKHQRLGLRPKVWDLEPRLLEKKRC